MEGITHIENRLCNFYIMPGAARFDLCGPAYYQLVYINKDMEERKLLTSSELLDKVRDKISAVGIGNPDGLYAPIRYSLSAGGKRIRPVLMLLAYNMYKDDVDSIIENALGLETYHNFTLLHDDLMDKADVRRGNPTVHKKWDANTAILSGDAMLILAYKLM